MIGNAGTLVDYIKEAVLSHGATPHTEVFVRVGSDGPLMAITELKGYQDQRGFCLVLETSMILNASPPIGMGN